MKTLIPLVAFLIMIAGRANAQLSVYSNGKVSVATSTTPSSTFSVVEGKDGYEASVVGSKRGVYSESKGQYLNWAYGVYGKSNCTSASFQTGVQGEASIPSPQSSCRTYGVKGVAGNATNGWNYGIFGQLNGTNNGAGVYGTATHGENGVCVGGRYAGYFNGATKVNGNLTVTGSINGIILSQVSNTAALASTYTTEQDVVSMCDKLAALSATRFYTSSPVMQAEHMENVADSISTPASITETEGLVSERLHYGLDIEQLTQAFPELVYEQENGTIGINYMEMIPILIQAVNTLRSEVNVLKANRKASESSNSDATSVNLSTNGMLIGTKRVAHK